MLFETFSQEKADFCSLILVTQQLSNRRCTVCSSYYYFHLLHSSGQNVCMYCRDNARLTKVLVGIYNERLLLQIHYKHTQPHSLTHDKPIGPIEWPAYLLTICVGNDYSTLSYSWPTMRRG